MCPVASTTILLTARLCHPEPYLEPLGWGRGSGISAARGGSLRPGCFGQQEPGSDDFRSCCCPGHSPDVRECRCIGLGPSGAAGGRGRSSAAQFRPWTRTAPEFQQQIAGVLMTASGTHHCDVSILLDTGVTHCFISETLATTLQLRPSGSAGPESVATADHAKLI